MIRAENYIYCFAGGAIVIVLSFSLCTNAVRLA